MLFFLVLLGFSPSYSSGKKKDMEMHNSLWELQSDISLKYEGVFSFERKTNAWNGTKKKKKDWTKKKKTLAVCFRA